MEFQQIPIIYIKADPNQPRKFFDEAAQQELTSSIIEKEVIQPIIVRGQEPNYMLVCGERRLRSATIVMDMFPIRNTIPAVIRQMSDDEALELQIIENLQRKDVHPMEEAVAFESMLQHGMDAKAIAAKVGKSDFFIRQRIKLCSLSTDWQKAFFANRIALTEVLKIVTFDDISQDELYKMNENRTDKITFSNWDITKYSGRLTDGLFDLADKTLNGKMGPCINCQWNSATARLFEDSNNAICGNKGCFTIKCSNAFDRKIEEGLQDPAMIFVTENYSIQKNTLTARIEKAGYAVYDRNSYNTIDGDDAPDFQTFEEYWKDDHDDNMIGCLEAFEKEMQAWQDEQAEFEKGVTTGKFKKAFVVDGREKGKSVYIKLNNKKGTPAPSPKNDPAATSEKDIKEEIERLTTKEKRSKELDQEKVWENIRRHFNPFTNAELLKGELNQVENEAAALAIYEKISYDEWVTFCKLFKIKDSYNPNFSTTTDEQLRQMIRFFFLNALPASGMSVTSYKHAVCMKVAANYFPSVLSAAVSDQDKIAGKRILKVVNKITELDQQLKNLQPKKEKLAAAKKSAKNQQAEPEPEAKEQTPVVTMVQPAEDSTIKKAVKNLIGKNKGIKDLIREKIS